MAGFYLLRKGCALAEMVSLHERALVPDQRRRLATTIVPSTTTLPTSRYVGYAELASDQSLIPTRATVLATELSAQLVRGSPSFSSQRIFRIVGRIPKESTAMPIHTASIGESVLHQIMAAVRAPARHDALNRDSPPTPRQSERVNTTLGPTATARVYHPASACPASV